MAHSRMKTDQQRPFLRRPRWQAYQTHTLTSATLDVYKEKKEASSNEIKGCLRVMSNQDY